LLVLVGLVLSVSCSQQPSPESTATAPAPEPTVEAVLAPEKEYSDPELQARYEGEFNRNLKLFLPPDIGTLLAVRLNDGTFIGGALSKLDQDGITLRQGKEDLVATRQDVDPVFLPDLYLADFARQMAMAEIMIPTNLPMAPLFTRYAIKDHLDAHKGPGNRYQLRDDLLIPKGSRLDVLQRRGRWLLVVAPTVKTGDAFWVDFFQTMSLVDDPKDDYTPYLLLLLERGILARLTPEQNEAFVNEDAWAGTDSSEKEGVSRVLAAHCAQVRKASMVWIDIKGDHAGKRLARYSRAQGFRSL
jgi:hypothetical protein